MIVKKYFCDRCKREFASEKEYKSAKALYLDKDNTLGLIVYVDDLKLCDKCWRVFDYFLDPSKASNVDFIIEAIDKGALDEEKKGDEK